MKKMKQYPIEVYKLSDISDGNRKFLEPYADENGIISAFYRDKGFKNLEESKKYKEQQEVNVK